MKPRIGVLTSGGDCPGLNAVLRGVVLAAEKLRWEVIGFKDGFEGLLPPGHYMILDRARTAGIMPLGGNDHRDDESRPFRGQGRRRQSRGRRARR